MGWGRRGARISAVVCIATGTLLIVSISAAVATPGPDAPEHVWGTGVIFCASVLLWLAFGSVGRSPK